MTGLYEFERTDRKLEIAMKFINGVKQYAIKHNKQNMEKSVDKCLQKIKEI